MNFLQRFKFYLIGVALGSLIAYGLLIRGREFPAWLPGDRVLEELAVDSVIIAQGIQLPFPDSVLVTRIKSAKVLFDQSKVRDTDCKEYQLESKAERMRFRICEHKIELYEYDPK